MEEIKYFIGYEENGQIVKIDIEDSDYYKKGAKEANNLKNIDFFTQNFSHNAFLGFLKSSGLIKREQEIKLYKQIDNEKEELRGGIAFSGTEYYFDPTRINKYFIDNILDPRFLKAANKFFNYYFGLKESIPSSLPYQVILERENRVHKLYFAYAKLGDYLKFLSDAAKHDPQIELSYARKKQDEASERMCKGDCLSSVPKMIHWILYGDRIEETSENINYEGLHDLAIFVYEMQQTYHFNQPVNKRNRVIATTGNKHSYAQSDEAPGQGSLFKS